MLAEPYNLVLWHIAAMANECSAEVAQRGSPQWFNKLSSFARYPVYIRHVLPNEIFRMSDINGNFHIQLDLNNGIQHIESMDASPIEIDSISTVLRDYDKLIDEYIRNASERDLDFTAIDTTMDFRDDAIAQLGMFHLGGIRRLLDVNRLASIVEVILTITSSHTLTSHKNTAEMKNEMRNDLNEIRRRLTNSLVFDVASKIT